MNWMYPDLTMSGMIVPGATVPKCCICNARQCHTQTYVSTYVHAYKHACIHSCARTCTCAEKVPVCMRCYMCTRVHIRIQMSYYAGIQSSLHQEHDHAIAQGRVTLRYNIAYHNHATYHTITRHITYITTQCYNHSRRTYAYHNHITYHAMQHNT